MRKINLILLIIAFISCKSARLPAEQNKTLESIIAEKLGGSAIIQKNSDASFALCTSENLSTLSISYIIVKLNDLTIVEQNNVPRASFSWVDTYKIEVREIPGIVKKEHSTIDVRIIDVTKYMTKL